MLLMKLETKEKFAFLELAHHVSLVDGHFGVREKSLLSEYCAEMGIEDKIYDDNSFELDTVLAVFKSKKSKKIVILALMALVHVDDKFDLYEYKLIQKIALIFNLSELEINLFSQWGKSVTGLYAQAKFLIED